jgi:hypothetical protein
MLDDELGAPDEQFKLLVASVGVSGANHVTRSGPADAWVVRHTFGMNHEVNVAARGA